MRVDDLTCIIGKNDCGKSSILEALELFFLKKNPEIGDFCVSNSGSPMEIRCVFSGCSDPLVIDESNQTTLKAEYLFNSDEHLEVVKTYKTGGKITSSTYIRAMHPSADGAKDLLGLKISDAKKRAKERSVLLDGVNQTKLSEIRQAIRSSIGDLKLVDTLVPLDDIKDIWEQIEKQLPLFVLFKSDRASTDQDAEAQDPMQAAISEAIKGTQAELDSLAKKVEAEVEKVAARTIEKLREMAPGLANSLKPRFAKMKWDSVFKVSLDSDDGVPMNKRGSGVRRLILINFFRAKAELKRTDEGKGGIIYAIEEPETSQHPAHQRIILEALRDLSGGGNDQVIFTTHTPMLASLVEMAELRHVRIQGGVKVISSISTENDKTAISAELGVLPDNAVKLFVCVEGKNDIDFFLTLSDALRHDGVDVPCLRQLENDGHVVFVPLGGGNLAIWQSKLSPLRRREFHLYDRDVGDQTSTHQAAVEAINQITGCKAFLTHYRESENYLHPDAITEALHGVCVQITPETDVPVEVAKALREIVCQNDSKVIPWDQLDAEKRGSLESRAKKRLNTSAAEKMTKARLDIIDPAGEVLGWLNAIKELIAAHDQFGPVVPNTMTQVIR